jgi:hypothetical protein
MVRSAASDPEIVPPVAVVVVRTARRRVVHPVHGEHRPTAMALALPRRCSLAGVAAGSRHRAARARRRSVMVGNGASEAGSTAAGG